MESEQKTHIKSMPLFILPLLIGTFLATLNVTSVNIALPTLMSYFHTDMTTMQWIIVGYMLMNGLAMPTLGYFNNRFSGRNLLTFGFILLAFVSILCAIASNIELLIGARLLHGIAGGILMSVPFTLVYQFVPRHQQLMTTSIISTALATGTALGPTVGGLFISTFGWQSLFLFNVLPALLGGILVIKFVPYHIFDANQKLDILGLIIATIATVSLLFGFNQGSTLGWTSPLTLSLLGLGFIGLAYFILHELKSHNPMLNFNVFRYKGFRYAFLFYIVSGVAMYMTPIYMAIFLQSVTGLNAFEAGLAMLIPTLSMSLMSPVAAKCTKYASRQILILIGMLIFLLATWQISLFTVTTSLVGFSIWLSARYMGIGLLTPLSTDISLGSVPPMYSSHASAMTGWMRQISSTIGVSIFSLMYNNHLLQYEVECIAAGLNPVTQQQIIQANAISDVNFYTMILIIICLPLISLLKDSNLEQKE